MLRQPLILFLVTLEVFLLSSLDATGDDFRVIGILRILRTLRILRINTLYHTEWLVMTNDLRVNRIGGRATERQIIHSVQYVRLTHPIMSDQTIDFRRQQ